MQSRAARILPHRDHREPRLRGRLYDVITLAYESINILYLRLFSVSWYHLTSLRHIRLEVQRMKTSRLHPSVSGSPLSPGAVVNRSPFSLSEIVLLLELRAVILVIAVVVILLPRAG